MSLSWTVVMPECGDNSRKIEQNILQKLLKLDIYIYLLSAAYLVLVGSLVWRWRDGEEASRQGGGR